MSTRAKNPLNLQKVTRKPLVAAKSAKQRFSDSNTNVAQPRAVFRNVDYQTKGECVVPENYRKVVAFIEENYTIPDDFEVSSAFGVHSGTCYERRLIAAYTWGQLNPKDGATHQKMCVECGALGHFRDDCEELLRQ